MRACNTRAASEMSRMQLLTWRKKLLWPSLSLLAPGTLCEVWSEKSLKIGTSSSHGQMGQNIFTG